MPDIRRTTNKGIHGQPRPDPQPQGRRKRRLLCPGRGAAGSAEELRPEDEELTLLAKALAHPVHILILRNLLRIGTCYFRRLADLLPVAASTASQHLSIVKEAGLVKGEIEGERPAPASISAS